MIPASLTLKINRIRQQIDELSARHAAKSQDIVVLANAIPNEFNPIQKSKLEENKKALEAELIAIEQQVEQKEHMLSKLNTLGGRSKFHEYFVRLNFKLHKLAFTSYLDHDKKYGAFALHSNIRKNNLTWLFNNILLQYPQIGSVDNIWVLYMGDFKIEDINELLDSLIEHMELEDFDPEMLFEEKLELIKNTLLARLQTESIAIVIYGACEVVEENEIDEEEIALKAIIEKVWKEIVLHIEREQPSGWLINFFIDRTGELSHHLSDDFMVMIDGEQAIADNVLKSIAEKKLLTLPEVKEITAQEFYDWVNDHLMRDELNPGFPFGTFHRQFNCLAQCEAFFGGKKINAEKLFAKICKTFNLKFKEAQHKWEIH